jgi:hypothetical protein
MDNKMNTIMFLIVVSIVLISTDLIYHQVNGLDWRDPYYMAGIRAYGLDEDYPPFNDNNTPEFCKSLKDLNLTESAPDCTKR